MRYFIDTNIFIFLCADPDEVDPGIKALLEDCGNTVILSAESLREIAMLLKNKRIDINWKSFQDVKNSALLLGMEIRYVSEAHLKTLYNLRPAPRHSDPADLMIIAQAITENIPLISSDTQFPLYTAQGLEFVFNKRPAAKRRGT